MVFCHACLEEIEELEKAIDMHGGFTFHKECKPHGFKDGLPEWEHET